MRQFWKSRFNQNKETELSLSHKLQILRGYYIYKNSKSEISSELFISYSIVWRIVYEAKNNNKYRIKFYESELLKETLKIEAIKDVDKFFELERRLFNSKDVQEYIKAERNVALHQKTIIDYMKRELNLSLKRFHPDLYLKTFAEYMF